MTSDCYAILGVTPAAEDVVIRAAYRALMRHYHPDSNPDPTAQARAQAITAAYAMLRDPAKRAEYDASRSAGADFWYAQELRERPPPAMRGAGIAAAVFALALVGAVWAWPQNDQPAPPASVPADVGQSPWDPEPAHAAPAIELQPESERLARLREESEIPSARPAMTPPPDETVPDETVPPEPVLTRKTIRTASAGPARAPVRVRPKPRPAKVARAPIAPPASVSKAAARPEPAIARSSGGKNERLETLDRLSAGFFRQSMANANPAKKELLLNARGRLVALRKACRSDSCLADTYVRQMREISTIMESRPTPAQ